MAENSWRLNMRIQLRSLPFNLPEQPFLSAIDQYSQLEHEIKKVVKGAGTNNDKFKHAWEKLFNNIQSINDVSIVLDDKIDIRALGIALTSQLKDSINISSKVLNRIDEIVDKPSSLFIESFFQYYLNDFNNIKNYEVVSPWLIKARKTRNLSQWYDDKLISPNGAKWVADRAISNNKDFDQIISELELDHYQSGDFMENAQRIYYVEQLKKIPTNLPHELLIEVQKKDVFQSRFDDSELLGHKILKVLIDRAPSENIHESWLNVIMAIAGDPRIPNSHPRYINWWSHIPDHFISKVRGWLSRLDLKLFLEALEDFSNSSYDAEMKRMYPSRKRFLEGLYDQKLIQNTRLYMSRQMAHFLRKNYKSEHLPDFSIVTDNDKSIIYVDLGDAHIIEGSHSCYLWIYKELDASATVYDYGKPKETYYELTSGLDRKMKVKGLASKANITHNPKNFSWQRKAVETLKDLKVPVSMKDVLTPEDYRIYVRMYGAS
jgi:hypothetical protein